MKDLGHKCEMNSLLIFLSICRIITDTARTMHDFNY